MLKKKIRPILEVLKPKIGTNSIIKRRKKIDSVHCLKCGKSEEWEKNIIMKKSKFSHDCQKNMWHETQKKQQK